MRFMVIVRANKDSEGRVMPEEKLIAGMATFHGSYLTLMISVRVMQLNAFARSRNNGSRNLKRWHQ